MFGRATIRLGIGPHFSYNGTEHNMSTGDWLPANARETLPLERVILNNSLTASVNVRTFSCGGLAIHHTEQPYAPARIYTPATRHVYTKVTVVKC